MSVNNMSVKPKKNSKRKRTTSDKHSRKRRKKKLFKEWVIPVLAAICMALMINKFLIYNVFISSGSMIPTINIGDRIMVSKVYDTDNINRGDIVVFHSKELKSNLIKRVIGISGDHIEIENGIVRVNGVELKEEYVKNSDYSEGVLEFDVPENKFFFLGDNRADSYDSRKWSEPYIDSSDIEAKAFLRFYPFKSFGSIK